MSAASSASRRAYRVRVLFLVAGILISADGVWGAASTQNGQDEALCAPVILKDNTDGTIEGVIGMKNTMGYAGLDSIAAIQKSQVADGGCGLKIARMKNKFGAIVEANSDTAQAAVKANSLLLRESPACPGFGLCADIFDASTAEVWPIATLTYFVIGLNNTDSEHNCGKVKATYDYTKWILTDAKAAETAKSLQFAAMPNAVSEAAMEIMDQMNCTKDGVTTLVKNWPSAATSINGAGSSLQKGLQTKLTNEYNIKTSVVVTYQSTGSGTGKTMFNANSVDFAGSDSLIKMTGSTEKLRKQRMIPVFAAAVGIMYNNKNVDNLVLSREAVNGIFTGTISGWANAAIKATNPGVDWPNDAIIRIGRKDSSGTTEALTLSLYGFAGLNMSNGIPTQLTAHPLQGSALPKWPQYTLPFLDKATCVFKNCTKNICLPGFRLVEADDLCEACPAGTFSSVRGQQTNCTACAAGTYTNTPGNSKCSKCNERTYQDATGQSSCVSCPTNTLRFFREVRTVVSGANGINSTVINRESTPGVSVDECFCKKNHWLPESTNRSTLGGLECKDCPTGATCMGFVNNEQTIPVPMADFWGDARNPSTMIECRSAACAGNYGCLEGHMGRLCVGVSDGYYAVGRYWYQKCPSSVVGSNDNIVMTVFIWVAIFMFWIKIQNWIAGKYDTFAIFVYACQMISFLTKFNLRWAKEIKWVGSALSIMSFEVDFVSPNCMFGWTDYHTFFIQLSLPGIFAVLWAIIFKVRKFLSSQSELEDIDKTVRSKTVLLDVSHLPDDLWTFVYCKTLSITILCFQANTWRAFSPFVCDTLADGKTSYMALSPEIQCGSGIHTSMVIASVIYIPFVIILLPIYMYRKLDYGLKTNRLNSYAFMEVWGWIYLKYRQEVPYWEVGTLLRRAVVAIILVFVRLPMLQTALSILTLIIALCANCILLPFIQEEAVLGENLSIYMAIILALVGFLSYPSVDSSNECVGTIEVLESIGPICRTNIDTKNNIKICMIVFWIFIVMWYMSKLIKSLTEAILSNRSSSRIGRDRKNFKRWMSVISRTGSTDSSRFNSMTLNTESNYFSGLRSAFSTLKGSSNKVENARGEEDDPELQVISNMDSKLEDMIDGFRLSSWYAKVRENNHEAKDFIKKISSERQGDGAMEFAPYILGQKGQLNISQWSIQELAFLEIEKFIPKFCTIYDHVNGYYARDMFAKVLVDVNRALPDVLDFLLMANKSEINGLTNFVDSFVAYRRAYDHSAFQEIIMKEHRSIVMHWLMECSNEQRNKFHILMSAISEAAGMQSFRYGHGAVVKDRDRNLRRASVIPGKIDDEIESDELRSAQNALEIIVNSRNPEADGQANNREKGSGWGQSGHPADTPRGPRGIKEGGERKEDHEAVKPWWETEDNGQDDNMWPAINDDASMSHHSGRNSMVEP